MFLLRVLNIVALSDVNKEWSPLEEDAKVNDGTQRKLSNLGIN